MKTNYQNCQSVWQAFEKYVYKQVCSKGQILDTLLVGIFRKVDDQI